MAGSSNGSGSPKNNFLQVLRAAGGCDEFGLGERVAADEYHVNTLLLKLADQRPAFLNKAAEVDGVGAGALDPRTSALKSCSPRVSPS